MKNLTNKQQELHNFLLTGKKVSQINNMLFMDDASLNGKVWVSYMVKMFGSDYREQMKKNVNIIK